MNGPPALRLAWRGPAPAALAVLCAVAALGFLLSWHPILLFWAGLYLAATAHVILERRVSLPLLVGGLALGGLIKRSLFLMPPVEQIEYFAAVLLPDVLLAGCVMAAWMRLREGRRSEVTGADLAVGALFVYVAAQVFNPRGDWVVGLAGFKLAGIPIMAYVVGRGAGRESGEVERLWRSVGGVAVLGAVLGLLEWVAGPPSFDIEWMNSGLTGLQERHRAGEGGLRLISIFESHEQMGFFLGLALLAISRGSMAGREAVAALVIGASLFLTYSRSSWLALASGLTGLVLLRRSPACFRVAGIFLPAALLGVSAVGAAWISEFRFDLDFAPASRALASGTFSARATGWAEFQAEEAYGTVLGNGIGSLWAAASKFDSLATAPHNGILQWIYELGWLGLFIFLLAWIALLREAGGTACPPEAWPALAYMLGVMVSNSSVAELMHLRQVTVPFWLAAGVVVSQARLRPDDSRQEIPHQQGPEGAVGRDVTSP